MATLFDLWGQDNLERDCLAGWRAGVSLARITWQDEHGAEHLCVATERSWALAQLAAIEREPGYRLVSCAVR